MLEEMPLSGLKAVALRPESNADNGRSAGRRHVAVALTVLVAHGLALAALLHTHVLRVQPEMAVTVSFIETPKREPPADPLERPHPAPIKAHLVFEAPQLSIPSDVTAPAEAAQQSHAPETAAHTAPEAQAGPMALNDELAVFCPTRSPPTYPLKSKHLHEQGEVTLRVELDEQGKVQYVGIVKSSGFAQLDEAALAALLNWRCNAALRDGKPTRSVAIQTFEFVLLRH